ncbi:hypothetical protein CY34DRAFT_799547 [Suillus luteus UH-Slu-Lm8-n1]|uniref:PH domain-containing protein n=1 Tax=Suillus luteus UH-Slu-Lm8-n1 TaxID=930992 RepID=A0A0D0BW72_9AGAM|nr:hypothetical protein CY34DRAFT_799547 [Suillus luteus UH-Slu-Lm8-n1]
MEWMNPWNKSLSSQKPLESPATMPIHFFTESQRSFGDRRQSLTREPKGKEKEYVDHVDFPYDQASAAALLPNFTGATSISSHESSLRYPYLYPAQQSKSTPKPIPPRKPRTSLLFSLVRKKTGPPSHVSQYPNPIVMPGVMEISRPYSYVQEEEERERLRDAAAHSIGLVDYAASEHPEDTREDQVPPSATIDSRDISLPSPIPPSPIPSPTPTLLSQLPPFPTTLASLSSRITLTGTFPKFCPSSSLLVYALAKQWKTRSIILTTATSAASQTVTHLHLFKSNIPSSLELHRLPITQDTAIYVTEQSGPSMNSTRTSTLSKRESRSGARGSGGKSSGSVVAIEQGNIIWHFEMQDPSERQKWIGAIKAIVLGQRSMRAGLTASPHLSGHEPRGDMDVMLSMRLQASLSSATSPISPSVSSPRTSSSPPPVLAGSPPLSPPTSPIRGSLSLEGMRSQPHTRSSTPIPPAPTELFTRESSIKSTKKSQSQSPSAHRSGSRSTPNSGSSSPTPSICLQSKRSGNISPVMLSQTHSSKSSTSTTKTIKGMFTPRSRSPSLSLNGHGHERESEYTEESFGTVGSSLMGITSGVGVSTKRSSSPMRRSDSPVPSVASTVPDGSSVHLLNESIHNGSMSNSVGGTSSMTCASINGISASDLKIVKEDERWAPPPSTTEPLPHTHSHPHSHSHSHSHSLQPPPRYRKQTFMHPLTDVLCQQLDTSTTPSVQTSTVTEDSSGTTITPRSITPIPTPTLNPARLSVQTTSTTISTVERSGSSASSSTPSRRWSRTLPKRLTPPSGPLPLTPQAPHESELSVSPSSAGSENPGAAFWKRTSGSSSVSSASVRSGSVQRTSTVGSFTSGIGMGIGGGGSGSIGVGSKRRSMPPPRPAPSFAPPPAPEQQQQQPQPQPQPQKTLFRTSVAQRALRLSLTAPRPPPSGVLPPRPDEPTYADHHNSAELSIPTSIPPRPDSAASVRSMSIKQRLRILSAPSPPSPVIASHDTDTDLTPHQIAYPVIMPVPGMTSSSRSPSPNSPTHSRPQTPPLPGTPITTMQNHPSFLSPNTHTSLPTIPQRNPLRASQPQRLPSAPEIRALSPPPRRGSKQLVLQCVADGEDDEKERADGRVDSELPDFSDIRAHVPVASLRSELDGV